VLFHEAFFMVEVVLGVADQRGKDIDQLLGMLPVREAIGELIDQMSQMLVMLIEFFNPDAKGRVPGNLGPWSELSLRADQQFFPRT
jgi:hypothetical protein